MSRTAALALAGLVAAAAFACGGQANDTAASGDALDFSATTVGGGEIRGADYAGSPLIVWFWAPW